MIPRDCFPIYISTSVCSSRVLKKSTGFSLNFETTTEDAEKIKGHQESKGQERKHQIWPISWYVLMIYCAFLLSSHISFCICISSSTLFHLYSYLPDFKTCDFVWVLVSSYGELTPRSRVSHCMIRSTLRPSGRMWQATLTILRFHAKNDWRL